MVAGLRTGLCSAALVLVVVLAGFAPAAWGAPPILQWPLACTPNRDCWIANHVDLDPGPAARDYACGVLTYDAHKGTDIAVRDLLAMEEGVSVLAAAAGRVRGVRDGMPDSNARATGKEAIRDRECGNGLVIDHGEGWETQYCHLRRGSTRVKPGEQVAAGQALGLVGLSGLTEYPHLHLSVRRDGRTVDPFRGAADGADCTTRDSLWRADVGATLPYVPGVIYNAGFAPEMPTAESIRSGQYRKSGVIGPQAPVLAFYVEIFGVRPGDALEIRVSAPDGSMLIERRVAFDRQQARRFSVVGKRRPAQGWPVGVYRGEARMIRADGSASPPLSPAAEIEVKLR
jgi:murein DD-endopeptidase MepM/ murein hydrolase activator NlpD